MKRQEQDCRAVAERKGWEIGEMYVDNDVGAWSGKRRPEYRRMLDDIKAGAVDAVIVWHLDRLTRRPVELEEFFEVCDAAGVRNLACVTGDVDLSTHDGQFMARILGAVARKESDDKSRRTIRKHLELAEAGRAVGGTRPFGYESDRVTLRPVEADLIREAAVRVLAGETVYGLVADWIRRGIPTSRGGRWHQGVFRRMLQNPRLIAKRAYKGKVVADGQWPAILDEVTFARLQVVLAGRHTNVGFGARSYVLTGFLFCGKPASGGNVCGKRLIANAKEGRNRTYVCSSRPEIGGCGGIRVTAEALEEEVLQRLLVVVSGGTLAAEVAARADGLDEGDVLADIAALESKLEELAGMWAAGNLETGEWVAARQGVERRLNAARRRLVRRVEDEQVRTWAGRSVELEAFWRADTTSLSQRRAILAAWVETIMVKPVTERKPWFEPGRVHVAYKA
ncbi:MAG: recombinase family protein [Actinomycetota bacterium]|nr:recombinase family protein [Actinomycetota bacterium]